MALGTSPNPLISNTTKGLEVNKWKCIVADEANGKTTKEGVYAGGDAVTGAATVILAMEAGRAGAKEFTSSCPELRQNSLEFKITNKKKAGAKRPAGVKGHDRQISCPALVSKYLRRSGPEKSETEKRRIEKGERRENRMKKQVDLLHGKIVSSLTELALPIMGTAAVQMAYNLTDMAWIGRVGASAVASVGAAGMYTWLSNGPVMLAKMEDR